MSQDENPSFSTFKLETVCSFAFWYVKPGVFSSWVQVVQSSSKSLHFWNLGIHCTGSCRLNVSVFYFCGLLLSSRGLLWLFSSLTLSLKISDVFLFLLSCFFFLFVFFFFTLVTCLLIIYGVFVKNWKWCLSELYH